MQIPIPTTLIPTLREFVHYLVVGDYAQAESSPGFYMSAQDVASIIADYGATLIDLPDVAMESVETEVPTSNGDWEPTTINLLTTSALASWSQGYWVGIIHLWTKEEGRSNLRLELAVYPDPQQRIEIQRLRGFPPKLIPILQELVRQLANGDYIGLEEQGRLANGWTAASLDRYMSQLVEKASRDNPGQPCYLLDMSVESFADADAYRIDGAPSSWKVDLDPQWSNGCLDYLTLQAIVQANPNGMRAQLIDYHQL